MVPHTCVHSSGFMFLNGVVDDHELHVLYPLQYGHAPLHWAASGGHTTCVEHLLSTPGIDLNIKDWVSWFTPPFCYLLADPGTSDRTRNETPY